VEKPIAHLACSFDILKSCPLAHRCWRIVFFTDLRFTPTLGGTHQVPLVVTSDASRKREPSGQWFKERTLSPLLPEYRCGKYRDRVNALRRSRLLHRTSKLSERSRIRSKSSRVILTAIISESCCLRSPLPQPLNQTVPDGYVIPLYTQTMTLSVRL